MIKAKPKQTPMNGAYSRHFQGHREWFSSHDYLGGISFDEKIIFVSPNAEFNDGRYDFTIAHEICIAPCLSKLIS